MFDITGKELIAIYVSGPHKIYNNDLFVLFELDNCYLFFDGWAFSIISDKSSVALNNYEAVDHRVLGDNLRITKAFILESWWCYLMFNNGEAFHVYQTHNGITWWQKYELILKNNTDRYSGFIQAISDDEIVDEIDLSNLEEYNGHLDINNNVTS